MSWIATPAAGHYPLYMRWLFAFRDAIGQPVSEPVRQWARTPRVLRAFLRLYRAIDRTASPIEPALRSLIMVRVSQINVCPFCIDLNASRALERDVAEDRLWALDRFETSDLFSEREKAALAFTEAVTITGRVVDPALKARLGAAFPADAIVELAALIAFQNMSSKFNAALEIPAAGICRVPIAAGTAA
ncbi:carboxymuconolactone decarboxylase family protein [Blastochloris sulfoviridis]|uniref:Carboxymuconolactone decarboxylase family protein n=1 Tax=Blastochloris sulfoviridis TaxID=50712 RepID=A0A5M6I5W6_9HYPH|nr:carboxymuconolactone decarboxylase family protein [Blastochloris sulfoviridis]KAA5603169.1 carboxymuconolactone decarboxylase family protein [Blastochloris sulfoviridis]